MRWKPIVTCDCPSQAEAVLQSQKAHVPHWETDTWSWWRITRDWIQDRVSRLRDWLKAKGFPVDRGRRYGGTWWPAGWPKPRTCSYCGSAHPDDFVLLMRYGWEVEATSKPYKRYLHPPGWAAALHEIRTAAERGTEAWIGAKRQSSMRSSIPPVKLYVGHMSRDQVEAFNAVIREKLHVMGEARRRRVLGLPPCDRESGKP